MKRAKHDKITCSCCNKPRDPSELSKIQQECVARQCVPWWTSGSDWAVQAAKTRSIQWACQRCLGTGKALLARPWLQTFCDHAPYLAHFDKHRTCQMCGKGFVFSAKEQRYWYEQLKFWVQSVPKQCPTCRRKIRRRKESQKKLGEALENLDPNDPDQLIKVAKCYLELGSVKKGADFLKRAKNRTQSPEARKKLIRQIEKLEG